MPRAVYVLAVGIFAMVTSEFAVGGLMPQMAGGLGVTVSQIGYLITAFAVAISVAVQLSRPEVRGRALAVVLNGLMLGTLLGLPLSTLIGGQFGWRAAFWAVGVLTVLAALATTAGVPALGRAGGDGDFRQEMAVFRNGRLWLALSTSTLIIGATFAAFSYLSPILTQVTGFPSGAVPLLLVAYGAATVVGNHVVGRLADRHTVRVLHGFGLRAPFWLGAGLAALGVASLLPELGRRTGARSSAPSRVDPCLASPAGQERP
ncbi:MFS transporter [Nonomuraea sp. NPDC049758]|uniref:MFS transporter n=1 Tax=Nonomuraea sp. NPDC049758 TaxID=3154360 RepID=UPI00343053C5